MISKETCNLAADELGVKFYASELNGEYMDRPVGCYYSSKHDRLEFNTLHDPAANWDVLPKAYKGVCQKGIIFVISCTVECNYKNF